MSDKIEESLKAQKDQLVKLKEQKEQAELALKQLNEAIPQLNGAIQALEYVKTLNLVEPEPDKSESKLKAVK